jgi:hypothetical protein
VPWDEIKDRGERYGADTMKKRDIREDIELVEVHTMGRRGYVYRDVVYETRHNKRTAEIK